MRDAKRMVLMAVFAVTVAVAPMVGLADEKVEGKVVSTNLTLCHPRPTGGGCEGTLTLETKANATSQQVEIQVIADTIIRKGRDYLLLPATQGSSVVVSYVREKGQKVAKAIDVIDATR